MFLDELAAVLVTQGVGVIDTNIFLSAAALIPTGAGPYLTLNETGGMAPTRIQNARPPNTQRPTAAIWVRAADYQDALTMIRAAYVALDGLFNVTLSGTFYLHITARQEPTDIGVLDGSGRAQLVFNIDAEKSPS